MSDRATDVALFRYGLIREAADPKITKAERGRLVRDLAERTHVGPSGEPVEVSRGTLDRWIRAWRCGGFEALRPSERQVEPRTPAGLLALACDLRREDPARTATHISSMIEAVYEWAPSARTLQRHFAAQGLRRAELTAANVAFGRFEAGFPNELWVGDALHGPVIERKKAILFCYLDDCSRLATGYRFVHTEDTLRAEAALRVGLASRGVPGSLYLDNGSPFVARPLLRALAVLGVRLVHSRPGRPQGRGKVERFFRTVRDQFLVEVAHSTITTLAELNDRFRAWVESVYHHRVHSETQMTPLERFCSAGPPALPDPALLREAFLWSETRLVTKTATVSLHGNLYEVDPVLVGRRVELLFDPFDLAHIEVRHGGTTMGEAVPRVIGRHAHPKANPAASEPKVSTGIEYLELIQARHDRQTTERIDFTALSANPDNDEENAQ